MSDLGQARIIKTSLDKAVVVKNLTVVDLDPNVLASGLPVLLEAELARFVTEPPETRKKLWEQRVSAIGEYRTLKAANPSLTVDSPWEGA